MTRLAFRLAGATLLVSLVMAGTASATDRSNVPARTAPGGVAPVTAATPAPPTPASPTPASPTAGGQQTIGVTIPCALPKVQHCDPAHPDAP
jgi:hypothetical protein